MGTMAKEYIYIQYTYYEAFLSITLIRIIRIDNVDLFVGSSLVWLQITKSIQAMSNFSGMKSTRKVMISDMSKANRWNFSTNQTKLTFHPCA
jgi:hypothetical protein